MASPCVEGRVACTSGPVGLITLHK
jgi:hypothetical protein